jgi:hypothetical protein
MSYTVDLLNSIRNGASTEYQTRVPLATRDNIAAVGFAVTTYEPTLNEFTNALVNKIAKTVVSSKMASNRLAKFKKGDLPYGKTIEELFVSMAKSEGWDPTGANPLGRRLPDIKSIYHTENRKDVYPVTLQEDEVKGAFTSEAGVQALSEKIIESMYSGSEYDEFVIMKQLIAEYEANFFDYGVTAITDEASARSFVKTVRKAVADLSFTSSTYNKGGVKTQSLPQDQVLIVHKDVISHVDVDVLAKAFNLGKTDFEPSIVVVDDFGDMLNTYGVLIDKDWFMVYDTLKKVATQPNAQGLFTNYFYHVRQVMSTSLFKNAVRFTTVPKV